MRTFTNQEQIIQITPYTEFQIVLKANPQNGYLWYLVNNTSVYVHFVEEIKESLPRYMGCKQHFIFQSHEVSIDKIDFIYKRSWETTPYDTANFIVEIIES